MEAISGSREAQQEKASATLHGGADSVHSPGERAPKEERASAKAAKVQDSSAQKVDPPYFLRVRNCLPWWELNGSAEAIKLVKEGVPCPQMPPVLSVQPQHKSAEDIKKALAVMDDYLEVKAVRLVTRQQAAHLVPWFVISKPEGEGEKLRLIADCRQVNKFLNPLHFKLDHWEQIFPFLKVGLWGAKVDLKNAYFHLELSQALKPYICMAIGEKTFQFDSACFGLSTLPQQWMVIMKVFAKLWRTRGILCFIYLDDILVLNSSPAAVKKDLEFILQTLEDAGMVVNYKKSSLTPTQTVEHLGFVLDLKKGVLTVPNHKLKMARKQLGKIFLAEHMTCRKMSSILGSIRSLLVALPFLRSFTDQMLQFVSQANSQGWDSVHKIPGALKEELKEIKQLLADWQGRPFLEKDFNATLHSDSSDYAWAGVHLGTGQVVQEFWRGKKVLHINVKELQAAIQTVMSVAKPQKRFICVSTIQ